MGNRHDLNLPRNSFPVNQSEWKFPEQKLSSKVRANGPTFGCGSDLGQRAIHFYIELKSGILVPLQIPVEGSIVFLVAS